MEGERTDGIDADVITNSKYGPTEWHYVDDEPMAVDTRLVVATDNAKECIESVDNCEYVFWSLCWRIKTGKFWFLNSVALSEKPQAVRRRSLFFAGQPNHLD